MTPQQERRAFLARQIDGQLSGIVPDDQTKLRIKSLIESVVQAIDDVRHVSLLGVADQIDQATAGMARDGALSGRGRAFFDQFTAGVRRSAEENRFGGLLGEAERARLAK